MMLATLISYVIYVFEDYVTEFRVKIAKESNIGTDSAVRSVMSRTSHVKIRFTPRPGHVKTWLRQCCRGKASGW